MMQKDIIYTPGLYKIFDEILVNAADHKQRDPSMNCIKVNIDKENQSISVWNNGAGIPVEIHQKEKIYVPELIFGNLLTSSNYDDDEKKVVGGRNGFGAKLANIFSLQFTIETADAQRGKLYKQTFRNNMSEKDDPVIKKNSRNESYTKISFSPDLSRFGMTHFDEDIVSLLKKRVYDIAGINSSLKVYLNEKKLPIKNFKDYVQLYSRDDEESPILYERLDDRWEVAVAASDGQLSQISFVNSIWTIKGGTHVGHVADQFVTKLSEHIAKKNKGTKVKPFQIKNQLSLYVNCLIENPSFDSQTKETLTTKPTKFGSKWSFSDDLAKKVIKNSGIVENILAYAKFKESKELAKTDGGKKARVLGVPKLNEANKAGGREASKCTLILTEGDSAMALAISGLSVIGRDYYGVFPLRGKLLNVREAKHKQIMDNAEISNLKKILGLQHNKTYTADTIKSLRYGHVLIMADQDHDGSHIKGLVINFFDHFWPSLLKVDGFLQEFITPIVKCVRGKKDEKVFFTLPEFRDFFFGPQGKIKGWESKYYKGLGTSTAAEAKTYFSDLPRHLLEFQFLGEEDRDSIELAFSKQRVSDRKDWLSAFTPGTYFEHGVDELNYSNFVNKELILFSLADNARSIPSVIDGLKPSQRKVLFACFKRKLTRSEIKVVQLAGYVAEKAAYHHGEGSLQSTIVGLAQNFVGSNNVNFLVPAGQFGTRLQGGKDAASSRYIFTKLAPITRAMFPEVDDPLLKFLEDDGSSIEPLWYCPVIPTVLVNGSDGIGTGWSSSVPCYNPRDLIANIRNLLDNAPIKPMLPWYRGFNGSIVPVDNSKSFDVMGTLKKSSTPDSFIVEELPVRSWTTPYKEFLESNIIGNSDAKAPFIKDFQDNSTENKVSFTFSTNPDLTAELSSSAAYKRLKLVSSITTSNMVLFDRDGRIRKYETPEEIIQEFFDTRFKLYEQRREFLICKLEQELLCLDNKKRFILMVIDGKLKVAKRKKSELLAELSRLNFDPIQPPQKKSASESSDAEEDKDLDASSGSTSVLEKGYDYLLSMKLWSLTLEKVEQMSRQRESKAEEKSVMENTTPKELWERDLSRLEEALSRDEAANEAMVRDLERVAGEARARQRGGKSNGRKGKKAMQSYVEEDLVMVPLPRARTVAPKKVREKKAVVAKVKKTSSKTSKEGAQTAGKSVSKKKLTNIFEDESDSNESFSEYSDGDDIVELLEDVSLDTGVRRRRNGDKPASKRDQRKGAVRATRTSLTSSDSNEDDGMAEIASIDEIEPTKTRASRARRKAPGKITISDDELELAVENKSTVIDGPDSEEESLSLSQRLAQRLTMSENAPSKTVKKTVLKPPQKLSMSKRQRESKVKKEPVPVTIVSPSPSPKAKKTRVKSPAKPAEPKRRGKATNIVESEEDNSEEESDTPKVVPVRPRRQRKTVQTMVIVDSDSDEDNDSDFVQSDDDSDFE